VDEDCLQSLAGLPVFSAAGKDDPVVPYERSLKSAELLRLGGANLTFRSYVTGHKLNREGVQDLREWWGKR